MTADVVVRYEPRGGAAELFATRTSETVIAGPAGTGKSLACLFRLHLACLGTPGIRCLIVRKTAVSLGSTTLVTFEKKVAAEALRSRIVRWFGGSAREAASYRYSNGSVIVVGGMDNPDRVLSSEFDLILADEATELTETDWEVLGTRLRNNILAWQQQIAACNPAHPTHWIMQRTSRGTMHMLHSRHRDNPAYFHTDGTITPAGVDYMAKLDALTGVRRLRLRDGKWAAAEGIIYDGWDDAIHITERRPLPPEWPRTWGVDFGYVNPTAIQCWAEDPDGRLWLEWEHYMTQRTSDQHAARVLDHVTEPVPGYVHPAGAERYAYHGRRWIAPRPRAIVADHDAEGRAILERELGMSTVAAHKAVKDGIQAVQARLRPAGDGQPRLFILRDGLLERDPELVDAKKPTCTAEEITGYVWDAGAGKAPKDVPLKVDDHGMDCLRYVVAERDLAARPRVRSL